jgi:hypothetical protein
MARGKGRGLLAVPVPTCGTSPSLMNRGGKLEQTRGRGLAALVTLLLGTVLTVSAGAEPAASSTGDPALTTGYSDALEPDTLDPTDPIVTVQQGFAQSGAIFPDVALPGRTAYEAWRENLLQRHNLRFAFSTQMLSQYATATSPIAEEDFATGGIATLELIWSPHDRGGPTESSLVLRYGWRGNVFKNAQNPASFGLLNLGSNWSNYEFTNWQGGFKVEDLFLQQWFFDRRANFRIGNVGPQAVLNFSRFKDARVSFTASPYAFNDSIPWPTFGFGASMRVEPNPDSGLYMVGSINDMNGDPAALGLDWSTAFNERQFFYGFEVGNFWRRGPGDFDHIHLMVFWADERITRNANVLPNKAGWGMRVYGEKQVGQWVGFGGYTYNTAEGGGISTTTNAHVATAGLAYLNPLNIRGEASLGLMYAKPIKNIFAPLVNERDQYGAEMYWRLQLTPNLVVTPGAQLIVNPAFNRDSDFIAVPHVKFSLTF